MGVTRKHMTLYILCETGSRTCSDTSLYYYKGGGPKQKCNENEIKYIKNGWKRKTEEGHLQVFIARSWFFFQSLFTVLLQYMKGHGRIRRYISPIVSNKKEPDQLLLKYLFFSLTLIHCLYYKFQNWCRSITCFHSWSQVILPHDVLCRNLNIYYAIFKIVGMKFLSKWSLFDFCFIKGEFRSIMGKKFWFLKNFKLYLIVKLSRLFTVIDMCRSGSVWGRTNVDSTSRLIGCSIHWWRLFLCAFASF